MKKIERILKQTPVQQTRNQARVSEQFVSKEALYPGQGVSVLAYRLITSQTNNKETEREIKKLLKLIRKKRETKKNEN